MSNSISSIALGLVLVLFELSAAVLLIRPLRLRLVSRFVMKLVARVLPRMSDTERAALEAGTVWWDAELFGGRPRWQKLLDFKPQPLRPNEQAFLDGPVERLCELLDDWQITQDRDLPPEAWQFIKEQRFFGMIIPEQYGGLGFSALAHSAVVTKLASRSVTAAVTVMVPNSLGPGELLLHYGTDEQKLRYLPRLAQGLEIPCFGLTEPNAGSDAAATESIGVVCRGLYGGTEVLGIRLDWSKRYITLGPVATLLGLAFRLRDPQRLLGNDTEPGITVALIPTDTLGVEIGRRHDPQGVPFQNGPNSGRSVFVPLDAIVGGPSMAGQGWRMLMETLSAGRAISLPALSVGAGELAVRFVGAYATIRQQFGLPIGRFEGVQEPLARIGGLTYMMNAARLLTASAVDAGEKPSVLSAIVKCYLTEMMRDVLTQAMDVGAGAAICRGPRNVLAQAYSAAPIGVTVEGANIVTRTLIIFGQGAIRCHPFVQREMKAVKDQDVGAFDRAFFGHVFFVFKNALRAFWHGLTGSRTVSVPVHDASRRYLQRLTRLSAAFALVSDTAMLTLGGELKRREKLTGRLADALAFMYLASATIKHYADSDDKKADLPFMQWSCEYALSRAHDALDGVLRNLPNRFAAAMLRALIFPGGAAAALPSDALGGQLAAALLDGGKQRLRLTRDMFVSRAIDDPGLGQLETALTRVVAAAPALAKLNAAVKAGKIPQGDHLTQLQTAAHTGILDADEVARLNAAHVARERAVQVDAFGPRRPAIALESPARAPRRFAIG